MAGMTLEQAERAAKDAAHAAKAAAEKAQVLADHARLLAEGSPSPANLDGAALTLAIFGLALILGAIAYDPDDGASDLMKSLCVVALPAVMVAAALGVLWVALSSGGTLAVIAGVVAVFAAGVAAAGSVRALQRAEADAAGEAPAGEGRVK